MVGRFRVPSVGHRSTSQALSSTSSSLAGAFPLPPAMEEEAAIGKQGQVTGPGWGDVVLGITLLSRGALTALDGSLHSPGPTARRAGGMEALWCDGLGPRSKEHIDPWAACGGGLGG